jgi:hypothetical protein
MRWVAIAAVWLACLAGAALLGPVRAGEPTWQLTWVGQASGLTLGDCAKERDLLLSNKENTVSAVCRRSK